MKVSWRSVPVVSTAFMTASVAQAHPGHDGHELTWDFSHLAAFPVATLLCLGAAATTVWIAWALLRRAATLRVQSLRGSQANRGK